MPDRRFSTRELSPLPMTLRVLYVLAMADLPPTRGEIHTKLGNIPRDTELTRPLRDLRQPRHGFKIKTLKISRTEYRYFLNWRQKGKAIKVVEAAVAAMKLRRAA